MTETKVVSSGLSGTTAIFIALMVLKLTGVIDWSWFWLWIAFLVFFCLAFVIAWFRGEAR